MLNCYCGRLLENALALDHHIRTEHPVQQIYKCPTCSLDFLDPTTLAIHERTHSVKRSRCYKCSRRFESVQERNQHILTCTKKNQRVQSGTGPPDSFNLISTAFNHNIKKYTYSFPPKTKLINILHRVIYSKAIPVIMSEMQHNSYKVNIALTMLFYKASDDTQVTDPPIVFRSEPITLYQNSDESFVFQNIQITLSNMDIQIENFQNISSGYVIKSFLKIDIEFIKTDYLRTGTYTSLPAKLKGKHSILNIKSNDDYCLAYCIIVPQRHNFKQSTSYKSNPLL